MKPAIALLVLAVGVLCSLAYSQNSALHQQENQVRQLQAKLDAIPKTASIELREKCARQAREEFKLYGWDKEAMAGVVNHYDMRLDKCFMMIES
jgi:Tfp pilus assembly protein PilV